MRKYLLVALAALSLCAACVDTKDCAITTSTRSGTVMFAYRNANGDNVQGEVATDDTGAATVTVPSSIDCGSISTRGLPEMDVFMLEM